MSRGGYRPGAGRPKGAKTKKPQKKSKEQSVIPDDIKSEAAAEGLTPLAYMLKVMNDPEADKERRDRMAVSAAPYVHARKGEGKGKKDERDEKAKAAGSGRFAPSKPPLALVK